MFVVKKNYIVVPVMICDPFGIADTSAIVGARTAIFRFTPALANGWPG
jgi:hypothetical protein